LPKRRIELSRKKEGKTSRARARQKKTNSAHTNRSTQRTLRKKKDIRLRKRRKLYNQKKEMQPIGQ